MKLDDDTKLALLDAVNTLIVSPDAHRLYEAVEVVGPLALRHPVRLIADADVLNPLLLLRARDRDAFDRVVQLIEARRAERGLDPLTQTVPAGFDKVEYQRNFMSQKRERQRIAVEIENLLRSDRDKLIGNARLEFMNRQSKRWKEQRDAFLNNVRAANGGTLAKAQTLTALDQFWSRIDAELEARRAAAQREAQNPVSMRAVSGESLAAALRR